MKKRFLAASMAAVMAISLCACSSAVGASQPQTPQASSGETTQGASAEDSSSEDTQASDGEKVTLSLCWWGNQTRNDVTKQAVDLYMSQNPNVEIKVEFTDWTGYWDKLSTMAAGGNLPDIIQQDYSYISQYQQSGQLADLTPSIEDGTIETENIPQSIIDSGSIDGKCYALSLGSNAPMMVYDKAIVEEAGVTIPDQMTLDDLYNISQEIYNKTGVSALYDTGLTMAQLIARGDGSHLFDQLMAGDSTSIAKHFENIARFTSADFYISPELWAEKGANVVETRPIIDQTTWNDFSFSNLYNTFSTASGREMGMTMYPVDGEDMFLKPSMFFSIAETSPHKEEAAKFINWFLNSVECNEILMAERGVPVNTEVAEAIKPSVDSMTQVVFDYVAKVSEKASAIDAPDPAGKGEVETLLAQTADSIHYGEIDAAEATETYTADAQRILQEAAE